MATGKSCAVVLAVCTVFVSACAAPDDVISLPSSGRGLNQSACWQLPGIVRSFVQAARTQDKKVTAGLLRIFFHDCFPQGCDASILLGDGNSIGERRKGVIANDGLQQGALQLIENIRSNAHAQSQQCRDTVSCADILALATAEAVRQAGGPEFSVPVGRLDSLAPASDGDMGKLPRPFDDLGELKRRFGGKQLSDVDLVALSGAHTVGRARCKTFRDRTNSPKDNFAWGLRHFCSGPNSDERAHDLDATPVDFDNRYFVDLSRRKEERKGVLTSDVVLADDGSSLKWLVDLYARDQGRFFTDFGNSMRKLSLMSWRKPNEGEIRKHGCFRTNSGRFDVPHHLAAAA